MTARDALERLLRGRDLSREEAGSLLHSLVSREVTPAQAGALLIALRMKGETPEEIAGLAREMRALATPVRPRRTPLLDVCGTGGGECRVFNVSTASGLVAAAAGANVAKHGNRAMSGSCGSADVLEALGVRIDLPGPAAARCIDTVGFGFLFAPLYHPALKVVSGTRRELGVRTVFNLLGPLANPAGVTLQVVGVYEGGLCPTVAAALNALGAERAIVAHGAGMAEISTLGPTQVAELCEGEVRCYELTRQDFGLQAHAPALASLAAASTVAESATLLRSLLESPARDEAGRQRAELVCVNAAAALRVCGLAESWPDGYDLAVETLRSGRPAELLDRLAAFSQRADTAEEAD